MALLQRLIRGVTLVLAVGAAWAAAKADDRGWPLVPKDWPGQAAIKLGDKVVASDVQALIGQDLAAITNYEIGENTNAQGKVEQVKLCATNTFRKECGQWKMVGHQTDKLPYLAR